MAGDRMYGEIQGVVTKTLFCTHINSIAGKYEDMVSMTPVSHVTKEDIKLTINNVLQGLTQLGFIVVSVTTDNQRTNQSWHNFLGEGKHPEYILNPFSNKLKPCQRARELDIWMSYKSWQGYPLKPR